VETNRYDEAKKVLTDALEVIPEKETEKVQAIERRLTEVQELISVKEEETQEENQEDPLTVSMEVLDTRIYRIILILWNLPVKIFII
jgi:hypothetical protein